MYRRVGLPSLAVRVSGRPASRSSTVATAAANKGAPLRLLRAGLAAAGAGRVGAVSFRVGCSGGGLRGVDILLVPRRCGGVYPDGAVRIWSLLRGVVVYLVPALLPRFCLCRAVCCSSSRHGEPLDRSGAVPPPMRHDRLHPGGRAGCLLRRPQRGVILYSFDLVWLAFVSVLGMAAAVAQASAASEFRGVQGPVCYFHVVQGLLCNFGTAGPNLDVSCAFF